HIRLRGVSAGGGEGLGRCEHTTCGPGPCPDEVVGGVALKPRHGRGGAGGRQPSLQTHGTAGAPLGFNAIRAALEFRLASERLMAGANAPPTGFVDDWTTVLEPCDRVQTATASFVPGLIATRGSVFALKSSAVRSTGAPKLP